MYRVRLDRSRTGEYQNAASGIPDALRDHNLWYNYQSPAWQPRNLPVSDSNAVVGSDPFFADPSSDNFSITLSSPAAGKGLSLADPAFDYANNPFLPSRAIGALEAGSSSLVGPGRHYGKGYRVRPDKKNARPFTCTINGRLVKKNPCGVSPAGAYIRRSGDNAGIAVK